MEVWLIPVLVLVGLIALVVFFAMALKGWAISAYEYILQNPETNCDIDAFVGPENPASKIKVALAHKIQIGSRKAQSEAIALELHDSPHVPGLKVSRKASGDSASIPLEEYLKSNKPVVIATIRMGFGHHRVAYSAASWALKNGHATIFHDLLNIKSGTSLRSIAFFSNLTHLLDESDLIKSTDELYSKFSRMATEIGGPVEKLWGSAMMQGDANALRIAANVAAHLQPLLLAYPKDTPIITSHQLCALAASAVGFKNVVNLVVDNWPQWFLCVPNTLNMVQGPMNYQSFLKMGVQPVEWAGHWCPADMVDNIEEDCNRRIERANSRKPIRILIPVGGAGAQKKFIIAFLRELAPYIRQGLVQLFLNAGDHEHMKTAFLQILDECSLEFDMVGDTAGVRAFQKRLLTAKNEPNKAITLFAFDEYFPAVATTDILCRVADILSSKPSELAFYCVPKLHIRRVGDHEASSAKRAAELGDGTLEAREVEDAMRYLALFMESPDLLVSMNESIKANDTRGIYSGCAKAVEIVVEKSQSSERESAN